MSEASDHLMQTLSFCMPKSMFVVVRDQLLKNLMARVSKMVAFGADNPVNSTMKTSFGKFLELTQYCMERFVCNYVISLHLHVPLNLKYGYDCRS